MARRWPMFADKVAWMRSQAMQHATASRRISLHKHCTRAPREARKRDGFDARRSHFSVSRLIGSDKTIVLLFLLLLIWQKIKFASFAVLKRTMWTSSMACTPCGHCRRDCLSSKTLWFWNLTQFVWSLVNFSSSPKWLFGSSCRFPLNFLAFSHFRYFLIIWDSQIETFSPRSFGPASSFQKFL